jgi:putative endonuclease
MAITQRRKRGDLGESVACSYLEGRGFQVLERNYLKPWGEIDIVAVKDGVFRFVEVKTISRVKGTGGSRENMSAEDHIHPAKLKKLARTVDLYMSHVKKDADYQIDVVTVELDYSTRKASCRLYEQVL